MRDAVLRDRGRSAKWQSPGPQGQASQYQEGGSGRVPVRDAGQASTELASRGPGTHRTTVLLASPWVRS